MTYETSEVFQVLNEKYTEEDISKVVDHLFEEAKWIKCPTTASWRKVIPANDDEFANEDDNVVFIKPPGEPSGPSAVNYCNFHYRVYVMAKAYLETKHVYYHEPVGPMVEKAKVALLIASAAYYQKLENKVLKEGEFNNHS